MEIVVTSSQIIRHGDILLKTIEDAMRGQTRQLGEKKTNFGIMDLLGQQSVSLHFFGRPTLANISPCLQSGAPPTDR